MRVCIERAGPRHTILPLPPHYHARGERAVLVSGRKRPITALNEPHARSFSSSDSSASTGSRLPRPCPASSIGLVDDVASAGNASGGRPAVPTTGGGREAPAHCSNLVPAHANNNMFPRMAIILFPRVATILFPRMATTLFPRVAIILFLRVTTTLFPRMAPIIFPAIMLAQ
jgi:hypothetical protein